MSHKVFAALILSLTLAAASGPAAAAPITWTGTSFNNSWHNAANWNLNRVPGAGDDVIIPNLANPVVNFSSGTTTINSLDCDETFNVNGGSLIIAGSSSSIDGPFTMFGGTLTTGVTLNVTTSSVGWTGGTLSTTTFGVLRFSGSGSRTFGVGPILDSEGSVEFTNGTTTIGPGTTLDITGILAVTTPATVTINQDATIGHLVLNSGTLDGSGNLLLSTGFNWRAGTMSGTGATTITPTAVLNIDPEFGGPVLARHLYNENLINSFGAIHGTINSGGVIKNRAGGIIQFRGTAGFTGTSGVISNQAGGLIDKTVHSGTVWINTPVTNDPGAEIRVTSGTLYFNANVTNEGFIHSLPGTHLVFAGAANAFQSGSTLDVDNDVAFTIGTSSINPGAVVSVADSLRLIKFGILTGILNVDANISVPFYGHYGGTLQGNGSLTVTNGLFWNGGTMSGAGSTVLAPGSVNTIDLNVQTGAIALNRLLLNQGTCFYDGLYTMTIQSGGIFRNASGGTFNIPTESDIVSGGLFDNEAGGLLFKYGGSGESGITGTFTNNGTVRVSTGTLRVVNTFTNFASGTLTGGTYDLSTRFKFQGANIVTNAANLILNGSSSEIVNEFDADALGGLSTNAAAGTLTLKNGKVLTVTPAFTNAGYLGLGEGGTGQLVANAGFTQTAGATVLQNGTLTSSSLVRIQAGSLTGFGTIGGNLQNDGLLSPGFSPASISVLGTFLQTASGHFEAEIGGTVSGSTYDNLSVFGGASVGGHLQVSVINGFAPSPGQTFNVISASSRSGAFAVTNLPIAVGAACLQAAYLSNGVAIQAFGNASINTQPEDQTACPGSPVTFSVTIGGDPMFVQWRKNGVDIPDANGTSFTIASVAPPDSGTYDVVVTGACAAVTSDPAHLAIQCQSGVDDVEAANRPGVGYPVPNPSRGALRMGFSLVRSSPVTVDVIDIAGRRVASLIDSQDLAAGDHEITWNGMTTGGRQAASGLYFLRVVMDGRAVTRKVLVQR